MPVSVTVPVNVTAAVRVTGAVSATEADPAERTAARLLASSARKSYDPLVDVDWDAPVDPLRYATPPHRCSLYGTPLWVQLTEEQRCALSRHEVASIASVGIWFEVILMQMLIRHAYLRDPKSRHVQYAFTEIADECRHSTMFAQMIDKLGAPAYGPGTLAMRLGQFFKATSTSALTFASALYIEETLDSLQRETMRDESLLPLVRRVSEIHVTEEARHIRYATEELGRQLEALSPARRAYLRATLALACVFATDRLIHPRAYRAVGLDPRAARRAALGNPHWRASRAWAARKVVADFERLGLLAGPSRLLWKRAGLLP